MSVVRREENRQSLLVRELAASPWRWVSDWYGRVAATVRPNATARRGAAWGILWALTLFVVADVFNQPSGFGVVFDAGLTIVLTAVVVLLTATVVWILLAVIRRLPRFGTGLLIGAGVAITIESVPQLSVRFATLALTYCVAFCVVGGSIANLRSFGSVRRSRRILTAVVLVIAAGFLIAYVALAANDGSLDALSTWRPQTNAVPIVPGDDPRRMGPYAVKTLFYGSGDDIRRPEYGRSVTIRTQPLNAMAFLKGVGTWTRWIRKQYWGFDVDRLPLNARVWYPDGAGPFPLVLIVHGNHSMVDFSDPGYRYLGDLLASRGFIVASVDENFLNGAAGTLYRPTQPDLITERTVRAWMMLEHLALWRQWSVDRGNPFFGKVDLTRIGLMGHSRGGEAVATAALFNGLKYYPEDANVRFNYGFGIQALVAIAPTDGQYQPTGQPRWIEDVSYLTLHGGHDADQSNFRGSSQADRVRYTKSGPWFTAEIWAYRVNHGQFNTRWGRADFPPPRAWFLNRAQLIDSDDQERIAKTYIAAFLDTTLKGRREYLPLFKDWRTGRRWLPETIYVNRYRDASYIPLANFREDADLSSTTATGGGINAEHLTLWREGKIPTRQGDRGYNGVFLGWANIRGRSPAVYTVSLPPSAAQNWDVDKQSTVELSVAALDQDAPAPAGVPRADMPSPRDRDRVDFTIELVMSDGRSASAPVSRFAEIPPPLKTTMTKMKFVEKESYPKDWEPIFQTIRVPLGAFTERTSGFDPTRLSAVRLRFDRSATAVICISAIGFGTD